MVSFDTGTQKAFHASPRNVLATEKRGPNVPNEQADSGSTRVLSIDALRGFDMFWIIGGGTLLATLADVWPNPATETIQRQLHHVTWQGFRFEDLIFPLFIFLLGAVLPFALSRRLERGQSSLRVHLHVVKRTAVLLLLGLIFNGLLRFDWPNMRWPGVLQRIALCYFFAALLVIHTKWRTQAIVVVVALLAYWAVTMLVPVPGFGAGNLKPEGCLSSYIDQRLIPGKLCYGHGDNEGVISTLPGICTALLGALAGHWLRSDRSGSRKAVGLAVAGIVCLAAGWAWGQVFPIIKILWTSSFVLFAGGWSLLLLALFYWVIDVLGFKRWAFFFIVIGVNPITIYFLQRFVDFRGMAGFFFGGLADYAGLYAPLVLPFGALLIRWLLLWFLYRHKIFFKV
jgi:predicted acyltransferase